VTVEQRGTWYVSDCPAVLHIPFKVTEVNFYNLGYYTVMVDLDYRFRPEHERIVIEPREIVRERRLKHPTDILIVRTNQRISPLYYLLKGEETDGSQVS